jgi:hypothetical protein
VGWCGIVGAVDGSRTIGLDDAAALEMQGKPDVMGADELAALPLRSWDVRLDGGGTASVTAERLWAPQGGPVSPLVFSTGDRIEAVFASGEWAFAVPQLGWDERDGEAV